MLHGVGSFECSTFRSWKQPCFRLQVLYQARIHPEVTGAGMAPAQVAALHAAITSILAQAVAIDADSARMPPDWLFHFRHAATASMMLDSACMQLVVDEHDF